MMTVLVTAEDTLPLLGTDHPAFMKILRDAISVAPDNEVPEIPGAQLCKQEELAEQDQHTSVVDVERNLGRNVSKREEETTVHIENETTKCKGEG